MWRSYHPDWGRTLVPSDLVFIEGGVATALLVAPGGIGVADLTL